MVVNQLNVISYLTIYIKYENQFSGPERLMRIHIALCVHLEKALRSLLEIIVPVLNLFKVTKHFPGNIFSLL